MNPLDSYLPRPGLSVPLVTVLDDQGRFLEDEQRALIRFTIGQGTGADILFAAGTTGEWDRTDNQRRQAVARVTVEECRRNTAGSRKIEAWAGITAPSTAETLANLAHAVEIQADAAVVAPLSIADSTSPVDLVERQIGRTFDKLGRTIPVFLYDNAGIAAAGKPPHLHTRDVKRMSRLDYVRGIKVTASKTVLGNYTRAASHFKASHEFAIYAGNPYLIFDLFAPPEGFPGLVRHYWNRYLTQRSMPYGVVAGPANVMPREWKRAWQVCRAGETGLMRRYQEAVEGFRSCCGFTRSGRPYRPTIACLKAALVELGVCHSDGVATGTPTLDARERSEFARRFHSFLDLRRELLAADQDGDPEGETETVEHD